MTTERPIQRSGGGILSRGGGRTSSPPIDKTDMPALTRSWRRRWASGVAIATATSESGGFRGVTLTAVLPVSLEPPIIGFALAREGEFLTVIRSAGRCCIHILDRGQEFFAERFAGRAPVPDAVFSGVPHEIVEGIPVLSGTAAWVMGSVDRIVPTGDHVVVLLQVTSGMIGTDTDDPLLSYEGRYRSLEPS